MDFETKRQEIEGKLQRELDGVYEYQKIQVVDYGEVRYSFKRIDISVNIVDLDYDREIGLLSFIDGDLLKVEGTICGDTIKALQKIINEEN